MASPNVKEFTTDNWQSDVIRGGMPVLVDFWAPWCGPCRALSPIVDRLADQFAGKVAIGKLNVDENPEVAAQYGVSSIPRILVFSGTGSAEPVKSLVGLQSEAALTQMLNGVAG